MSCWFNHFLDSRAEILQIFGWFFGKFKKSKSHSEINWPLNLQNYVNILKLKYVFLSCQPISIKSTRENKNCGVCQWCRARNFPVSCCKSLTDHMLSWHHNLVDSKLCNTQKTSKSLDNIWQNQTIPKWRQWNWLSKVSFYVLVPFEFYS